MSASSRLRGRPVENSRAVSYEGNASYMAPKRGVPARGPAGPERSAQRARAVLDSVFSGADLAASRKRVRENSPLQEGNQGGIDLVRAAPANPVASPSRMSFCLRSGTRSISLTSLAPIRPVITPSFDPAMNSDGWWTPCHGAVSSQFRSILRYQFSPPRKPDFR